MLRLQCIILIAILFIDLTGCSNRHPAYSDYDAAIRILVNSQLPTFFRK